MNKALPIMIQGTSSDAGKSILVTALCRIFYQDGYKTAPFKSQNMALNSFVTPEGKEIGRAQGVQAEAAGIIATTDMNPILIKPNRNNDSQIVVHGEPYQNIKFSSYRSDFFATGLKLIEEAYGRLAQSYERIVIEGAGSPAEINLNDRELVNMRVARIANAPVILVADIERGGVFASLVGTLQLLEPEDRQRVIGVIINKFRGDVKLLKPWIDWFEKYTGKPVLGVIPFIEDLYVDAEDSLALQKYRSYLDNTGDNETLDIAVIKYPRISNFTDIDPFFVEPDCNVRFVSESGQLGEPDLVILPGSKNTMEDFLFLRKQGLDTKILSLYKNGRTLIFGICGGYQMMGERISDPYHVESPHQELNGLRLIPMETTLEKKKSVACSSGVISFADEDFRVEGYEIHMGRSFYQTEGAHLIKLADRTDGYVDVKKKLIGTYFHGIFHNDRFRWAFLNEMRRMKGLSPLIDRESFTVLREQAFDLLANHVRKHVQVDWIHKKMREMSEPVGRG